MHTSLPSHSLDSPPPTQRVLVTSQGPPLTPLQTPSQNKPITLIAACCSASRAEAKGEYHSFSHLPLTRSAISPAKTSTHTHRRETNATYFIAPACTVTDTPLPPGRPAGQLGPSCLLTPHTPKISQRNPPLDFVRSLLHPFNGGYGVEMNASKEPPVSEKSGTPTLQISQDAYQPSTTGTVLVSLAPAFLKKSK